MDNLEYSPFKRISDRVVAINNQSAVMRNSYDHIDKTNRKKAEYDTDKELDVLEKASDEIAQLSSELRSAIQKARGAGHGQ